MSRGDEAARTLVQQVAYGAAPVNEADRDRLADLLVDAVGAAVAGGSSPAARAVARAAAGSHAVWDAACADGTAIHGLDFDDTHEPSLCHTGAAIVPAVLRLAAARQRSGGQLLQAYAAGIRLVDHLAPAGPLLNEKGIHSTAVLGALGAAAASASLLGAGPAAAAAAVELAAVMAAGLCVSFGTQAKPLQAGRAAETGIRAAMLADSGLEGPDGALLGPRGVLAVLLGEQPLAALPQPGPRPAAVSNVAVKLYPSCLLTHTPIDLTLEARRRLGLCGPDDVERVWLTVHPIVAELADKMALDSDLDAKFSVRYCLLAALTDNAVTVESFTPAARQRILGTGDRWLPWAGRVELEQDRSRPRLSATITVRRAGGRVTTLTSDGPSGGTKRPLRSEQIRQKFLSNAAAVLGDRGAAGLLNRVLAIPDAADVAEAGDLLGAGRS